MRREWVGVGVNRSKDKSIQDDTDQPKQVARYLALDSTGRIERKVTREVVEVQGVARRPLREFGPYDLQWFDLMFELALVGLMPRGGGVG